MGKIQHPRNFAIRRPLPAILLICGRNLESLGIRRISIIQLVLDILEACRKKLRSQN